MSKEKKDIYNVGPWLLIIIGIIFLLDQLNIVSNAWSKLWPLILIVIGVAKLVSYYRHK